MSIAASTKSGERLRNYRNSIGPSVAVSSQTIVYLTGTPLPTQQD